MEDADETIPDSTVEDGGPCLICGGRTETRKCKIICTNCGYLRDCSDP
jgi:hypothetical protein